MAYRQGVESVWVAWRRLEQLPEDQRPERGDRWPQGEPSPITPPCGTSLPNRRPAHLRRTHHPHGDAMKRAVRGLGWMVLMSSSDGGPAWAPRGPALPAHPGLPQCIRCLSLGLILFQWGLSPAGPSFRRQAAGDGGLLACPHFPYPAMGPRSQRLPRLGAPRPASSLPVGRLPPAPRRTAPDLAAVLIPRRIFGPHLGTALVHFTSRDVP